MRQQRENYTATPVAHPVISNVTWWGTCPRKQTRHPAPRRYPGGNLQRHRDGQSQLSDGRDHQTETARSTAPPSLHVALANELSSKEGIYTNDKFAAGEGNLTNQTSLTGKYVGTIPGGKVPSGSSSRTPLQGAVPPTTTGRRAGRCNRIDSEYSLETAQFVPSFIFVFMNRLTRISLTLTAALLMCLS